MSLKKYLITAAYTFILLASCMDSFAQLNFDWKKDRPSREFFSRVTYLQGDVIRRNHPFFQTPDENGVLLKKILSFSAEIGWQTGGDATWEGICNYPRFGIGLNHLVFRKRDELGNPWSLYGFFNGHFIRGKRFQWQHQVGAGIALGFNKYNPEISIINEMIGSDINAYIEAGTSLAYEVLPGLFAEAGVKLVHFSNGNTRLPQKGINVGAIQASVRYHFQSDAPYYPTVEKPACANRHELYSSIGVGSRQFDFTKEDNSLPPETYGFKYFMTNLTMGYLYELRHQLKVGGGFDLFYDGSNGAGVQFDANGNARKVDRNFTDHAGALGFIGVELVADRFAVSINAAYVLARNEFNTTTTPFQQRVGVKYHFLKNIFAGVDIMATEFHVAKFVQYKVGMRRYLNADS